MTQTEAWNYFVEDPAYVDVLAERLRDGVEMDSAQGLANVMQDRLTGDLSLIDFGSGPGHYLPVIRRVYTHGAVSYRGIDIIPSSVAIGNDHFAADPAVSFEVGSALAPEKSYRGEACVMSANTLPHIPSIAPLFHFMRDTDTVEAFAFRMLVGQECVETRKHLSGTDFDGLFESGFQHNNIYSAAYLQHLLGDGWEIEVIDDHVDPERLRQHRIAAQDGDAFYGNRVSRLVDGMTFKGDLFMPWKFVFGRRRG